MSSAYISSSTYGSFYKPKSSAGDLEEKVARELQRLKIENESKQKEIEKIIADSEEIRQLKEKIKAAYVNKERMAQIADQQIRRLDEIVIINSHY